MFTDKSPVKILKTIPDQSFSRRPGVGQKLRPFSSVSVCGFVRCWSDTFITVCPMRLAIGGSIPAWHLVASLVVVSIRLVILSDMFATVKCKVYPSSGTIFSSGKQQ